MCTLNPSRRRPYDAENGFRLDGGRGFSTLASEAGQEAWWPFRPAAAVRGIDGRGKIPRDCVDFSQCRNSPIGGVSLGASRDQPAIRRAGGLLRVREFTRRGALPSRRNCTMVVQRGIRGFAITAERNGPLSAERRELSLAAQKSEMLPAARVAVYDHEPH
jgi:hypothetical protein